MKKWFGDFADAWHWAWRAHPEYKSGWAALGIITAVGVLVLAANGCTPEERAQIQHEERMRDYETSLQKADAFRYFVHPATELCFARVGRQLRARVECDERFMEAANEDALRVSEQHNLDELLANMRFFKARAIGQCLVRDGFDDIASVPCTPSVLAVIDQQCGSERNPVPQEAPPSEANAPAATSVPAAAPDTPSEAAQTGE